MSIEHLKKQAKNLSRLLPQHLTDHAKPDTLAACQELIAAVHGFPSWHAAISRKGSLSEPRPNSLPAAGTAGPDSRTDPANLAEEPTAMPSQFEPAKLLQWASNGVVCSQGHAVSAVRHLNEVGLGPRIAPAAHKALSALSMGVLPSQEACTAALAQLAAAPSSLH